MQIRIKLYASLSKLLPEGVKPHEGFLLDIDDAMTPNQLIDLLKIPRPMAHLILCNGTYIKPADRDSAVFEPDDVFAVWPPVAGG
ncbi:MoaD/ThiS family protein [Methylonatrum kenyense]|uniref:MoaD/ThiS family protein n=1 Tax=Methylonatrum kenyense TaxID=455253 RepID=UPI0020BDC443|nr:MoaD/ThiS family protein [Methylonatrum kenyense]MCK8515577.1 MoaD/ThiS family protein [Methylonatrum kenyense]